MPSIDLTQIDVPTRTHRRLLTQVEPGVFEFCIDNTTLEKMLTCPRAFEQYAVFGRDSGERDALNYGTAVHKYCEIYFLGGTLQDMIDAVVKHFHEFPCAPDSWRNMDHCIESAKRYYQRREVLPPWRPIIYNDKLMVEVPFKIHLFEYNNLASEIAIKYPPSLIVADYQGPPIEVTPFNKIKVYWTGKIDLAYEDEKGIRPLDHKTSSIGGPTFWKAFALSQQMTGYTWAAKKLLPDKYVPGVMIDAIFGRPVTKTGASFENESQPFDYSDEQVSEWESDIAHHVRQVINDLCVGYFPKATMWCANKYGMCPYYDVCTMPKKYQSSVLMSGVYAEKTWSPLDHKAL